MLPSFELPATFIPLPLENFFPLDFPLCYGYYKHMRRKYVVFRQLFPDDKWRMAYITVSSETAMQMAMHYRMHGIRTQIRKVT
jgi:hypothetical protein